MSGCLGIVGEADRLGRDMSGLCKVGQLAFDRTPYLGQAASVATVRVSGQYSKDSAKIRTCQSTIRHCLGILVHPTTTRPCQVHRSLDCKEAQFGSLKLEEAAKEKAQSGTGPHCMGSELWPF